VKFQSRSKILLVEDNIEFAEILKEHLEATTEFQVMHFRTAQSALEHLRESPHRIVGVISDLYMRGMDGIEFATRLRQSHSGAHIPLIFVSGGDPMVFDSMLKDFAITGFFQKPVNIEKIENAVNLNFKTAAA